MIVLPAEIAAHFRYSLSAILWALALWSLKKLNDGEVRRQVSVNAVTGFGDPRRWQTLRRWARRHKQLWPSLVDKVRPTLRETAQAVVTALIARQSVAPALPLAADAWLAAHSPGLMAITRRTNRENLTPCR